MRLSVGAVLCLFLLILGAGCRKTLAPATDNRPPETWIVAAPQDTITTRDPSSGAPVPPGISAIPVRFHLYWAGSDHDGSVSGFFYAIVETTATVPPGAISVPPLPGPKARDYRFTTRTDSIFVFTASEELNTRQHAFFIYAVDDKGRADPTPARFIFRAYDSYPPEAIIEEFRAEGTEYKLLPPPTGGVYPVAWTRDVTDVYEPSNDHPFPRDTVLANARLYARWTSRPTIPSTIIKHYRYKLDESDFVFSPVTDTTVEYNTNASNQVSPGPKVFTLYAVGQSGWRGTATRWFQMNFAPDTWFAGPNPDDPPWQTHVDGNGKRYWYINLEFTGWGAFTGIPGSQMSSDSLQVLPAVRPQRKTFMEIYNNVVWLHQEGDTVHMNSWVVISGGGYDRDSPYAVNVNTELLKPEHVSPVLTPGPANGSPIGFRVRIPIRSLIDGRTPPSESTTYPVYDPTSTYDKQVINGYVGMTSSGRAYTELVAEDGNEAVDRRVERQPGKSIGIVDRVGNPATVDECIAAGHDSADCALRTKILTFYVNKAPRLMRENPNFEPDANELISRNATTGQVTQTFNMPAEDRDWYDPQAPLNRPGGTPSTYGPILERKIAILGKHPGTGRDTCYFVPQEFIAANNIQITIPLDIIAPGNITMRIRLCDCNACDVTPWTGKCAPPLLYPFREANQFDGMCVDTDIPVRLQAPAPEGAGGDAQATQRPGSPSDTGRRK